MKQEPILINTPITIIGKHVFNMRQLMTCLQKGTEGGSAIADANREEKRDRF